MRCNVPGFFLENSNSKEILLRSFSFSDDRPESFAANSGAGIANTKATVKK